ncbi:glycosyltransferase family 2 protein [Candidatus Peregrinibacteria bacterium]|nr:MAG: glycosyltransferase family 2 protein [Candidatus Peregrinibacteria bacterium]
MLSIIIPTYNNAAELHECLEHLNLQMTEHAFEVIVVNDGSTDQTEMVLKKWRAKKTSFELKTLLQENKKQGAARNRGVREATHHLIAFIGADILVEPNWLNTHVEFHQKNPDEKAAALGFTTWTPELGQDRFRKWLESSGVQFKYGPLKDGQKTDFWHFYTSNISMKKSWFLKFGFDETFKTYGWEDILLGYQMQKAGGTLTYLKSAKAYHMDPLTEEKVFPGRLENIGKSAVLFQQKCPDVRVIPTGIKKVIFKILSNSIIIVALGLLRKEWRWYALSKKYFLKGVNS